MNSKVKIDSVCENCRFIGLLVRM